MIEPMDKVDRVIYLFQKLTEKFNEKSRLDNLGFSREEFAIGEAIKETWKRAADELFDTTCKALVIAEEEG
jgi:hypothetical protein